MFFYRTFFFLLSFALTCTMQAELFARSSFPSVSDTLIIDGDTIYIEQNQVVLSKDSAQISADSPLIRVRRHFFSATAAFGVNASAVRFFSVDPTLLPLDKFMGVANAPRLNATTGIDIGARFLTIRAAAGSIELTAAVGFNYNQVKAAYTSLRVPSELDVDSVISFDGDDGDLALTYFTITDLPDIGEVDTLYPRLKKTQLQYSAMELAAKLRATLQLSNRPIRFIAETGVIRRQLKLRADENNFFLVNEAGRWVSVPSARLSGKTLLVPHFAVGAEWRIQDAPSFEGTYFTIGSFIHASMPLSTISQNDWMTLESGNFGWSLYGRFFF